MPPDQWVREVLEWLRKHGTRRFAKLDIWEEDWDQRHVEYFGGPSPVSLRDPRRRYERAVMRYFRFTQRWRSSLPVRGVDFMLRQMGW